MNYHPKIKLPIVVFIINFVRSQFLIEYSDKGEPSMRSTTYLDNHFSAGEKYFANYLGNSQMENKQNNQNEIEEKSDLESTVIVYDDSPSHKVETIMV